MDAAPLVTLIAVGVAIAVIAVFLITVVSQLAGIMSRLNTILGVVGGVIEKTEVLEPILAELSADLAAGHEAIDSSVQRLQTRKGYRDSQEAAPAPREPAGVGASEPVEPPPSTYRNY